MILIESEKSADERAVHVLDYPNIPHHEEYPFLQMNVFLTGMRKNCDLVIYIDVLKAISGKSN